MATLHPWAPRASATARPMPRDAPVTTHTPLSTEATGARSRRRWVRAGGQAKEGSAVRPTPANPPARRGGLLRRSSFWRQAPSNDGCPAGIAASLAAPDALLQDCLPDATPSSQPAGQQRSQPRGVIGGRRVEASAAAALTLERGAHGLASCAAVAGCRGLEQAGSLAHAPHVACAANRKPSATWARPAAGREAGGDQTGDPMRPALTECACRLQLLVQACRLHRQSLSHRDLRAADADQREA